MCQLVTCEHLQDLEASARKAGLEVAATGDWWGSGSAKSVYFACVLARDVIERSFRLPDFVEWHEYDGRAAGHEAGWRCKRCNSLLVGGCATYGDRVWPSPSAPTMDSSQKS